jgi:hypothetical protein
MSLGLVHSFVGTVALRGLHQELPLGDSFDERNTPFAERMLALGEGSESGSESYKIDVITYLIK